jgi:hypothetical protein
MENKNEIPDIDPKKLFDEKNYSTIVLKNNDSDEPVAKKKKTKPDLSNTIISLIDADKTELLKTLKEVKAQDTIIELIKKHEKTNYLSKLVALCWESGLDFGKHSNVFFDLSLSEDVFVSLEALTVLENIENFNSKEELEKGIDLLKKGADSNHPNKIMLEETRILLFEKLKSMNA